MLFSRSRRDHLVLSRFLRPSRRRMLVPSPSHTEKPSMFRPALRFAAIFFAGIAVLSIALRLEPVKDRLVVPFTAQLARACGLVLALLGTGTHVTGTQIESASGFSVN